MPFALFNTRIVLAALALLCVKPALAETPSLTPHTDTHTYLKLKPISDSYKTASLTFLPDLTDSENGWAGNNIGGGYNKNDCSAYPLSKCPDGAVCDKCPVGAGYRLNSCSSPYILSGGTCKCPPEVATFPNSTCAKSCDGKCVEQTCQKTPDDTNCDNGTQNCDDGCGGTTRKCCLACKDSVSSKPEHSSYSTQNCTDGTGTHTIKTGWTCDSGYHQIDGNTCEKDCITNNCSGYTLTSCPAGKECDSCTKTAANCSTNGTYYKISCNKTEQTCLTGYTLVNTCKNSNGNTVGDCVNCRDENSPYNPCKGYYICEGNKVGSGNTCNCGNQLYYEKCLVTETCLYPYRASTVAENCKSGIWDRTNNKCLTSWGSEPAFLTTTNINTCKSDVDGSTYYEYPSKCNASYYNAPCVGYKTADECKAANNGTPIVGGNFCSCGGEVLGTLCLAQCNYEETATSCTLKGKGFTVKCADDSGNQFGECS